MDDMNPQAQNVEEDNLEVTSPVTEPNTEPSQGQDEVTSTGDEGLSEEQDRKPSRAERRIREQSSKIRALEAQLSQIQTPQPPPWQQPNYSDTGEVTVEQVLGAANLSAEAVAERRTRDMQFKLDIRDVRSDYPELDPRSDSYDEEFDQEVAELYQQMGGVERGIRLTDVVNKVHKIMTRKEAKTQTQTAQTLARQAAEGALTPTAAKVTVSGPNLNDLFSRATDSGQDEDWAAYLKAKRLSGR